MAMENFEHFLQALSSSSNTSCIATLHTNHSYRDLQDEIERWQRHFHEAGIEPGAVVGIQADHCVFSAAALIAFWSLGAITALIPQEGAATQYLTDACASGLLRLSNDGSFELTQLSPAPDGHPLLEQLRADREAGLIIFTSGSTGRPKSALHSVNRFIGKFCRPCRSFVTLAFLAFDHVAGIDTLFYTLAARGTLVASRRRDPAAILELIERHRVEVLPASPSFLRMMCASPDLERYDLTSLRVITYGSEPMDAATLSRLNARFPNVQISQKYGTTETGSPRSASRSNESLWLHLKTDGTEMKVIDDVLWLRSDTLILGYLNAPSPLDPEGWYCTGDLVEVDGEWIRILGRASSMINVAGQKVMPAEVEQTILEIDFVSEAVVGGIPHSLLGNVVAARVLLHSQSPGPREATRLIQAHCRNRLASYKVPVKIDIVDDLAISRRGKIQRS